MLQVARSQRMLSYLLHDIKCDSLNLDVHLERTDACSTASNLHTRTRQIANYVINISIG